MTPDEISTIKNRCDEILDEYENGFRSYGAIATACVDYLIREDIPALLNALMEAERKHDHWKERAEQTEQAINEAIKSTGAELCDICKHHMPMAITECISEQSCKCGSQWEFDIDRFMQGGGGDE